MAAVKINNSRCIPVKSFYEMIQTRVSSIYNNHGFTLISLDIDNFNYINDLFSYKKGDITLERMTEHFSKHLEEGEFFSNIHDDHFLLYLDKTDIFSVQQRFSRLTTFGKCFYGILPKEYSLIVSGGAIVASDSQTPVNSLLDMANVARKRAKGSDTSILRIYDAKIADEIK